MPLIQFTTLIRLYTCLFMLLCLFTYVEIFCVPTFMDPSPQLLQEGYVTGNVLHLNIF